MTLDAAYDPDNIFAKIIRGEIPCIKLHETDEILAFMDIFPQTRGHCLVIPKHAEATNFFDIAPPDLQTLIVATQRVADAVRRALNPDGVRIIQFNGAPAGQTVFHIHFHIIPVYEGQTERLHAAGEPAKPDVLEPIAAAILAALD